MLEADDLLHLIVDQELSPGSTKGHAGASGNDAYIEIVGLEEQIEREDCSGERLDKKRINMEATRSAVVEALVLWGSKADLLQVRDRAGGRHHLPCLQEDLPQAGILVCASQLGAVVGFRRCVASSQLSCLLLLYTTASTATVTNYCHVLFAAGSMLKRLL